MGLERASTIFSMDDDWPLPNDKRSKGDDHLRNTKYTLKQQFPGSTGKGFNKAILSTEDELNFSQGLLKNTQEQLNTIVEALQNGLNTIIAPEGTLLLFGSLPPTGWTVQHYGTDRMIRIIDPDVDNFNAGGNDDPVNYSMSHAHTLRAAPIQVQSGSGSIVADTPTNSTTISWNPRYVAATVGRKDAI